MYFRSLLSLDKVFLLVLVSVPTVLALHQVAQWVSSVFSTPIFP